MASSAQSGDSDEIVGINVTPLVDIMLVLLIVFMVTAKLINSTGVPLDLPKGITSGTDQLQTIFSVSIAADGSTTVDSAKVLNDETVLELAKAAIAKTPDLRAVIKADTAVPHGRVLKVLDLLKVAKISKIAFATAPVGAGAPGAPAPGAPAAPK
jgi:biopolymer transport protein ExbD